MARFPLPLCVRADTSRALPPVAPEQVLHLADLEGADARSRSETVLRAAYTVPDPMDLRRAGWGVVFGAAADPKIEEQLSPLLQLREKQVGNTSLFQVFRGAARGVTTGLAAASWAASRGVSLTAPVDPRKGVPYYLLLVASPQEIPFEFQALLKMQWAVGRLFFEDIADYGAYARAVVEYEDPNFTPKQRKCAAVWMPRNVGDDATLLLSSAMSEDFRDPGNILGAERQFASEIFVAEAATKQQLVDIVSGAIESGPPALIFTGSHGMEYPLADVEAQREKQGALLTQEWQPGTPVGDSHLFTGDDVPASNTLHGAMVFLFACYSGGCPRFDSYTQNADGSPRAVASEALLAKLPRSLLRAGVLAVFAHVDMAFTYSFATEEETPQPQVLRTPLELLMSGVRAGLAADALTGIWSALSAQLAEGVPIDTFAAPARSREIVRRSNLTIARDEARNYLLLGDPATRLRVEALD